MPSIDGAPGRTTRAVRVHPHRQRCAGWRRRSPIGGFARNIALEEDVTAAGEKATALFASVERGERQIAYMASSYLSARVPALGALDLPFSMTTGRRRSRPWTAGPAPCCARPWPVTAASMCWPSGTTAFATSPTRCARLRTPADCAGLVIRTLDNAHYRALFDVARLPAP